MSRKISLFILTSSIVLLGFLREYLFANINWIYLTLVNGRRNGARTEFHFLLNWTPSKIDTLKWFLTLLFSILFLALTYAIIHLNFKKKKYNQMVLFSYLILLGLSVLLLGIGKVFGIYQDLYGVIRTLMGIVQSFMPLMVLYLLFKFLPIKEPS